MSRSLYASGTSGFAVFMIEPSCIFSTCKACVGISHSISVCGVANALDGLFRKRSPKMCFVISPKYNLNITQP